MNLVDKLLKGGLIGAHRGHRANFPENTMAAFQDCPGRCDFIELDVRFSSDGVPLVFHDHTLERTTNIHRCGLFPGREDHRIETFSYAELQHLDLGSWFYDADPYGQIAAGQALVPAIDERRQTIPDLDSVLTFIRDNNLGVNVEIKSLHKNTLASALKIIQSIREHRLLDQCVISAFDHSILKLLKRQDSDITTAALVEGYHPDQLEHYLGDIGVSGYHISDDLAKPELFERLQKSGFFVSVYTVNCPERKQALIDMGAGAVITDFLD